LFSLPSICDRLPEVGAEAPLGNELVVGEDYWRQFELVSGQFAADCDAEIVAIRRIQEQSRSESGALRAIHVRTRPDPPIAAALRLDDLSRAFGGMQARGVSYGGSPIRWGYSLRGADGLQCYGIAESGRVTVLGIVQDTASPARSRSANAIIGIAREFDLDLVDWCRCVRTSWDDPRFLELLLGAAA
jgi:hypothetical protein